MKINEQEIRTKTIDQEFKDLFRVGGVATLIASVLFRRNLGPEISLFSPITAPGSISDWFMLLQKHRLIGLAYLNFFDIVNYALMGLMFLALYAALRRVNKSYMIIATIFGIVGITVYFASNTAVSMLSLSNQYVAATTDVQREMLLAAGQATLGVYQGSGMYMSFLLLAIAGVIISIVMLRSNFFSRATAYMGILACTFDLIYCITFAFVPKIDVYLLSAAGLFLFIWHILIGVRLLRLGSGSTSTILNKLVSGSKGF